MALPSSASQVLSSRGVSLDFTESTQIRQSDGATTAPSMTVSLKLKPLSWKCNAKNGLMPLIGRRLQRVERASKHNAFRCSTECFPSVVDDLPANLQQQATLQQLRSARVIACLRTTSSNLALDAARAALDGGLTVLEVTMNTPAAAQVIKILVREYPSAIIGAGTVLSIREAHMAKDAGAQFLMSPVTVEEIIFEHRSGPVVYIPGAMTPTEVISAYNLGAPVVKLYPVALLGGVPFVRALSKPLGHIPMIASNGVSIGAMAVILSEAIFDTSALQDNDMDRIRILATAAVLRANLIPT